ncbi:hypothetical protein RHGRI_034960 [Rhododendron griersonianum]|uniref:Uncharacterized protein n=1 Tax=Rhododendron griersonianum TaxID=479676 RepID=A0AAV6I7C1_9ERIC|nr:hypothetical protein RHGRI_034960 [Rhododendron griersonianum]
MMQLWCHPTTAVSPQAPDYRKPPPNRPLPPPLPPLPLPSPRPLNAPPLRHRPRPHQLLRHCSPRSHENPRPNLLELTQIDDNDQVLVRVQGPCFQPLGRVLEADEEHLRPPATEQQASLVVSRREGRRDGGYDRED